jgi:uncharacterized protein (TIGR00730 family)
MVTDKERNDEAQAGEPETAPIQRAEDAEKSAIEPLEPASRKPSGPVSRGSYSTDNPELDDLINDLVAAVWRSLADQPLSAADLALTREMLTSSVRLALQHATRAELKLVNDALKEFAYSFRVFAPYRDQRKVSIFGSARVEPGDTAYLAAREFAAAIAQRGWMVITGAGPGIMAAGHEGAGAEHSFGANIRLPFLNPANIYIAKDGKLINFKYFFTRKVTFIKESSAFVLLPGGWGTLDEAFELLTLLQTGKSDLHPVVLLEREGGSYWHRWQQFIHDELLPRGFILESDLALFRVARTAMEAVEEIERFYANYHSARFVGDRLVLRLKRAPDAALLRSLDRDFADLLTQGRFEVIQPMAPEVREKDSLDLERLAFYPKHAYGRLRQLIDVLNGA